MSVIRGHGYGDSHDWYEPSDLNPLYPFGEGGRMIRPVGGPTGYRCLKCGIIFKHFYHDIVDIFEAMKASGIPDECANVND